jgi:ribulose-5-phosphate 4-epimerase/fuculose-1-phosphate aldolase
MRPAATLVEVDRRTSADFSVVTLDGEVVGGADRPSNSALGPDVGTAFRRALNLEEAATATYRMLLLGDTTTAFPPGVAHHAGPG